MTRSRNERGTAWRELLWAWRDLVRGSDRPAHDRRPDLARVPGPRLARLERDLRERCTAAAPTVRARRCLIGFFGVGEVPGTQGELAAEIGTSVSAVEKDLRAAIRGLAAHGDPPEVPAAGDTAAPGVDEAVRRLRGLPARTTTAALLRSWARVRPARRDGTLVGGGLAWWQAQLVPASTVLTAASVPFADRKQAQRARRAARNVLRVELGRGTPPDVRRTVLRAVPVVPAQDPDDTLDRAEAGLHVAATAEAARLLRHVDVRGLDPGQRRRHRQLSRTVLRLRNHPAAATRQVAPDGPVRTVVHEIVDRSLALTGALGAPAASDELIRVFRRRRGDELDRELRLHLDLARIDALDAVLRDRRGPPDRDATTGRLLDLLGATDELLRHLPRLTARGPAGGGTRPEEMRVGLRRRRADVLRRAVVEDGVGRRSAAQAAELVELWPTIVDGHRELSGWTLVQSLDSELAMALDLPRLAPRDARTVAEELHAARTAMTARSHRDWRADQAASLRRLLTSRGPA